MHSILLTNHRLWLNSHPVDSPATGAALLDYLYRTCIGDYPKYYKMDALCQLGFVASELLLQAETPAGLAMRPDRGTSYRAVLLFGRTGSLSADTHHQESISDARAFFPSPSVFVYTLPNIVTGEIAIRNQYYGETNFILIDRPSPHLMLPHIQSLFLDDDTQSVLVGWVDRPDANNYVATMAVMGRNDSRDELVGCLSIEK